MSVAGIASNILSALGSLHSRHSGAHARGVSGEFQELGQALQSGNLGQAQQDFTALNQDLGGTIVPTAGSSASSLDNSIGQVFKQLGSDLQSGNLAAAQSDFSVLQQDLQQPAASGSRATGHHHHHVGAARISAANPASQTGSITQEFEALAHALQASNLSGAQSAFATLQSDLQQISGTGFAGSPGVAGAPSIPSISVTA